MHFSAILCATALWGAVVEGLASPRHVHSPRDLVSRRRGPESIEARQDARRSTPKSNGTRAVGYYGNWDIYARNFFVNQINTTQLSHAIYTFCNVNTTTGAVYLSDEWADLQYAYDGDITNATGTNVYGGIKQLYLLKKKNRSLKTMLAVGGSTYSPNYVPVLQSKKMMKTFVETTLTLMTDLGFDGIDIDYEYVTNSTEAAAMVYLLKSLRHGMDHISRNQSTTPFLLSYASPAGPLKYTQLDFPSMNKYLDFYNYMGFDYAGGWDAPSANGSGIAAHSSNLFPSANNSASTPFSTSAALKYYLDVGKVPASMINLGSPLYSHAFAGTEGPGTHFNGTGTAGSFDIAGIWDYKALPLANASSIEYNLLDVGASYSYDKHAKYMISYDSPTISKLKAEYIMEQGYGGAMWWEVSQDKTDDDSLIAAAVETFGGAGALDSSLNHLDYPTSKYDNLRNGMPDE